MCVLTVTGFAVLVGSIELDPQSAAELDATMKALIAPIFVVFAVKLLWDWFVALAEDARKQAGPVQTTLVSAYARR